MLLVERVSCRSCSRPLGWDRRAFGPGGLCPLVCALARGENPPEVAADGRCRDRREPADRPRQGVLI